MLNATITKTVSVLRPVLLFEAATDERERSGPEGQGDFVYDPTDAGGPGQEAGG